MSRIRISGFAFLLSAQLQAFAQTDSLLDVNLHDLSDPNAAYASNVQDGHQVSYLSYSCDCSEASCGTGESRGSDCCDGVGCRAGVGGLATANPCANSHKGLFYANDFSYLKDPSYSGSCLGDRWKLIPVAGGDWGTLDVGGQVRLRYHSEVGMGREGAATTPRFRDTTTDFLLSRFRLYSDWKANDWLRIYTEGIFAEVTTDGGDYFPRAIDINQGDFLNLFADLRLTDSIAVRVGRQELLYGNQRLISPLDWANTRRTFEGVKLMYTKDDLTVDSFYTYFVPVDPDSLDESDSDQVFYGSYATYAGFENFTVEAYYIGKDNRPTDLSIHTLGLRINGSMGDWLWELEGGPQFGQQSSTLDHSAGFCTGGIGKKAHRLPGGATIWFYYDYASGDNGSGAFNGFDQLFPLAHKYFGFIDAVQRSNVESPNILLTMKPGKQWKLLIWYYHLMSNTNAAVPSVGNTAPQNDSKDLGDELDIILTYEIGPRSNVLFGWSHFWRGNKLATPTNEDEDADFIYGQWTLDF